MENFWTSQSNAFSKIQQESRKIIVHPALAAMVDQQPGIRILDYGCGDGSFIQKLQKHCEIHLYDISRDFLKQAGELLKAYHPTIHEDTGSIPGDYFDYVVNSLVLMTLPAKDDIRRMLQEIHRVLKSNGMALIAITHPCFRNESFSTFKTEYTKEKPFNYFKEGEAFEVAITDSHSNEEIHFYDYHWTLSTVLNLLQSCQLPIQQLFELPDQPGSNKFYNTLVSPYLVMNCRKIG